MQTIVAESVEHLNTLLSEHALVLVDYFKNNCPGCKIMDQHLEAFGKTEESKSIVLVKAQLEVLGVDHFKDLGLRTVPTVRVVKDGAEVARLMGPQPVAALQTAVNQHR